jgi:hypothetical protein
MSKIDDYNKLVDFIGNIIKASSDPEDQDGIDDALDIAHTIGDALEVFTDDKQKK